MAFRISGLSPEQFLPMFALSDEELACRGARRVVADSKPGFPDRVTLRDAEPGEALLLVNYTHQPAHNPRFLESNATIHDWDGSNRRALRWSITA